MAGFDGIIGYESLVSQLKKVIYQKKLAQTYLLCGPQGSGKKMLAGAIAQTLLCEAGGENACGVCKSCRQAQSGNHPDIRYVVREKATLGVKEIREQVVADVQIKPYSAKYKVYLISEAGKMTEEAQNALLKTIEEPPEYAVFLLMTEERERLLPTILSRCVTIALPTVATADIKKYLMEQKAVPDYLAESAAVFSAGAVGKAIDYAESEEFAALRSDVLRLVKSCDSMSMTELITSARQFAAQKEKVPDVCAMLAVWYRDVCVYKAVKSRENLMFREELTVIREQAEKKSMEKLQGIFDRLERVREQMQANVNLENVLELLFLYMKED